MGILPNSARHQQRICPLWQLCYIHFSDVIIGLIVSQITGVSMVCSGSDASRLWALWGEFYRWRVNSPHKGPVTQKMIYLMTSPWATMFRFQKYWTYYVYVPRSCYSYTGANWQSNIDNIGPLVQIKAIRVFRLKVITWLSNYPTVLRWCN